MHRLFRHVQFLLTVRAMFKRRLFREADLEAILLQPLKSREDHRNFARPEFQHQNFG